MLETKNRSPLQAATLDFEKHPAADAHGTDNYHLQAAGKQVIRLVEDLRPHPSFARNRLNVPIAALSVAVSQEELGLRERIVITQDNVIVKGYAQWELARSQGYETVACVEHILSDEEALHWLLQSHRRSPMLNDFARIVLALDLEPLLQERARANQRTGGQNKGSSTLAEAARMDVRSQIAAAAAVSSGNVTKVKQLLPVAQPDVREAVQLGELSIHRAWQWRGLSVEQQAQRLFEHQSAKGVRRTIRRLISRHLPAETPPVLAVPELLRGLQCVNGERLRTIQVAVVDTPGFGITVSKELFLAMDGQKELTL